MFHKISTVKPLQNMLLFVEFRDGTELIYNAGTLPAQNEIFNELKNPELFAQVKVDTGGYGISWNDDIDLDGEEIWAYLHDVWKAMKNAVNAGLSTHGILDGGLGVERKAQFLYNFQQNQQEHAGWHLLWKIYQMHCFQ